MFEASRPKPPSIPNAELSIIMPAPITPADPASIFPRFAPAHIIALPICDRAPPGNAATNDFAPPNATTPFAAVDNPPSAPAPISVTAVSFCTTSVFTIEVNAPPTALALRTRSVSRPSSGRPAASVSCCIVSTDLLISSFIPPNAAAAPRSVSPEPNPAIACVTFLRRSPDCATAVIVFNVRGASIPSCSKVRSDLSPPLEIASNTSSTASDGFDFTSCVNAVEVIPTVSAYTCNSPVPSRALRSMSDSIRLNTFAAR